MTPQEFCYWLDGYLAGAVYPDPDEIKAKAREIQPNIAAPQLWQPIGPLSDPTPWRVPPVTCESYISAAVAMMTDDTFNG